MNEHVPVPAGGTSSDGTPPQDGSGVLPHNIEAEQQLLGAILSSNDVLDRVEDLIKPDHFTTPSTTRSSARQFPHRQGAGDRRHDAEEFRGRHRGPQGAGRRGIPRQAAVVGHRHLPRATMRN
jgi:hypothetical protein